MAGFRHYFWTTGEPWRSIRAWAVPQLIRAGHSTLMCSLRISATGLHTARPYIESPGAGGGALFVTWHDLTLLPLHLFRHRNLNVMMSHSRSGQVQAALWRLHGFPTVWGSTGKREGVQSVREVLRLLREGQSFALTPDGPKGPRHRSQPGIIYFAAQAGVPIMPLGVAASAAWRLPTWDRHCIPKPFSRVHVHLGEALHIPPNISRADMTHWQRTVEDALNRAQMDAESYLTR